MLPPAYFASIKSNSQRRWELLEGDAELEGPWRQLFNQVQSPQHVVSELLQNADDANATAVSVSIQNGTFVFEHNGRDFSESEFASLCRFGYSNKRSLHTIGFRGIGFKSLFSLGATVSLKTPSLSIEFCKQRFTEPRWVDSEYHSNCTRIEVVIADQNRQADLEKNFEQWRSSPLSLLFFRSVRSLTIEGHCIEKQVMSSGPCENSAWISLHGSRFERLLHIWSDEAPFPDDAYEEIKQERNTDELNLPPCKVELVHCDDEKARLFVVLPTGVEPPLPFSCHAPFLQDPARYGIKSPATSPTNRWLLGRIGELAAQAMFQWLDNRKLDEKDRAESYLALLPPPDATGDSLEASVTEHVANSFRSACCETPILLTSDGELCFPPQCVAVPIAISSVWTSNEWDQILGTQSAPYLSRFVSEKARFNIKPWGWIKSVAPRDIVVSLMHNDAIPRPRTIYDILTLWSFVHRVNFDARSYNWLRDIHLVPVEAAETLHRSVDVIRLGERKPDLPDTEWKFFSSFVRVIDRAFLTELRNAELMASNREAIEMRQTNSLELLKDFELNSSTPLNQIVNKVCEQVASRNEIGNSDLIRLAHIFAALDANAPQNFIYINRKNGRVNLECGLMADSDDKLESVLPPDFLDKHTLDSNYERAPIACSLIQWRSWSSSPKSGLSVTCIIVKKKTDIYGRPYLLQFLSSVGVNGAIEFHYRTNTFSLDDWVISPTVSDYLAEQYSECGEVWAVLLTSLLSVPSDVLKHRLTANLLQIASTKTKRSLNTQPIPASWIRDLASKPCLRDIYGNPRVPADLLLRNPDTEPLLGIDSFVSADLDIPQNRPLLKMLGARDTASGTNQIVDRIRALAKSDRPPLHALAKCYEALDRAAARAKPNEIDQLREVFSSCPLIWTNDQQWSRSSEVFCFADSEVMPEAATIHDSVEKLPLWSRIGVADRPTEVVVLSWLGQLTVGEKLEVSTTRRVKACLANFPAQVFTEIQCWLSLDNHWLRISDFRYKLHEASSFRVSDLFISAKRHTADLRDISKAEIVDKLFAALDNLPTAIRQIISKTVFDGDCRMPPAWMKALGETLQRILLEDKESQELVRKLGKRVADTKMQIVESLQVTPYLNNEPVGQSIEHNVLWQESVLYLKKRKIVEILDELVSELQRPFHLSAMSDAIRVCVERTESFVIEYLDGKFDLEPVLSTALPQQFESKIVSDNGSFPIDTTSGRDEDDSGDPDGSVANNARRDFENIAVSDNTEIEIKQSQDSFFDSDAKSVNDASTPVVAATQVEEKACDDGASLAGVSIVDSSSDSLGIPEFTGLHEVGAEPSVHRLGDLDGNRQRSSSSESSKGPIRTKVSAADDNPGRAHEPAPTKQSLVERYLAAKGFVAVEDSFKNADGILLAKTAGLFTFEMRDATGQIVKHIWFKSQSLLDGLEVPAELWNLLKVNPERSVIVCEGFDGEPVELLGSLLLEELGHERVQLFTASYRLREIVPSRFSVR